MSDNWELYSNIDSLVTYDVWQELKAEPTRSELQPWYDLTMKLQEPCLFMMTNGLQIDVAKLHRERERVDRALENALEKLHSEVGFALNPLSPKQCQAYFYGLLGHTPYKSKEGRPTTDDTAMSRLARKGVKAASLVQDVRGLSKLRGTYLEMNFDEDNRLRCSLSTVGTRTSRLSSSRTIYKTGGNMQNLPPEVRGYIVPDAGHFFIEVDKAQAEWVITAYVSGEVNMIAAIESGVDVHAYTGHRMFGVPMDLIKAEDKLIGKSQDAELIEELRRKHLPELFLSGGHLPSSMSIRQGSKRANHGCNYRLQHKTFALKNEMSEAEAKPLVYGYSHVSYPGLPVWWDRCENDVRMNRKIKNCFGRPFYFYGTIDYKLVNDAIATCPQSTCAEILNRSIVDLYYDDDPDLEPLRLGMQVHDSLLSMYPIPKTEEDYWRIARVLVKIQRSLEPKLSYQGREFMVYSDFGLGWNWGDYDAERNPDGMSKIPRFTTEEEAYRHVVRFFNPEHG